MGAGNSTLAQDWYIDLMVSQYQCGPGYDIGNQVGYPIVYVRVKTKYILNQEFYCMAYAREYHQALLDDCVNQMAINISQGGDVCKAEQQMMNCQSLIFINACDFNAGKNLFSFKFSRKKRFIFCSPLLLISSGRTSVRNPLRSTPVYFLTKPLSSCDQSKFPLPILMPKTEIFYCLKLHLIIIGPPQTKLY